MQVAEVLDQSCAPRPSSRRGDLDLSLEVPLRSSGSHLLSQEYQTGEQDQEPQDRHQRGPDEKVAGGLVAFQCADRH